MLTIVKHASLYVVFFYVARRKKGFDSESR